MMINCQKGCTKKLKSSKFYKKQMLQFQKILLFWKIDSQQSNISNELEEWQLILILQLILLTKVIPFFQNVFLLPTKRTLYIVESTEKLTKLGDSEHNGEINFKSFNFLSKSFRWRYGIILFWFSRLIKIQ
jgi:hypothetical protein